MHDCVWVYVEMGGVTLSAGFLSWHACGSPEQGQFEPQSYVTSEAAHTRRPKHGRAGLAVTSALCQWAGRLGWPLHAAAGASAAAIRNR